MPRFTYALHPFVYDTTGGRARHRRPHGSACVLDWRPDSEVESFSQGATHKALFAFSDPANVPSGAIVLGSGYAPEFVVDNSVRAKLRQALGLSGNPAGNTLADCIADIYGPLSDPTGTQGTRPVMPRPDGTVEILLAGHSRIWSQKINSAAILSGNPTGRNNRIRDVLRNQVLVAFEVGGLAMAAKALGGILLKHGFGREEVKSGAAGRSQEWRRLIPPNLANDFGGSFKPALPTTTYTETWPNVAADITATAQDLAWVGLDGFTLAVLTGSTGFARNAAAFGEGTVMMDTAVSSADHTASLVLYEPGYLDAYFGIGWRKNDSPGRSMYRATVSGYGSWELYRRANGGSLTELATGSVTSITTGDVISGDAAGSTISTLYTGETTLSVTDTVLPSFLKSAISYSEGTADNTLNKVGVFIFTDGPDAPVAAFSGTPLSGTSPLSVAFTDSSTNTPTSWLWEKSSDGGSNWANFSSGHTSQNPTESFTAGTWAVRLTATNAGGSDGETKLAYVVVTAAGGAGVSALMLVRGVV